MPDCVHCAWPVIWSNNLARWVCSNTMRCGRRI